MDASGVPRHILIGGPHCFALHFLTALVLRFLWGGGVRVVKSEEATLVIRYQTDLCPLGILATAPADTGKVLFLLRLPMAVRS